MYTFIKTQLKRCPSVEGWYLKVNSSDFKLIDTLHGNITQKAFLKYNKDPHIEDGIKKGVISPILHPINMGTAWIQTIEKYRHIYPCILVNNVGGWMILDDSINILQEIQKDTLTFPVDNKLEDEWITISRWPLAKHFYIQSNKDRMFNKCNTLRKAMKEALRFVSKDRIKIIDANKNELSPEQ